MKNSYHHLLIDSHIESLLNRYCIDKAQSWAKHWGLNNANADWKTTVEKKYNTVQFESENICNSAFFKEKFIIGFDIPRSKKAIFSKIILKNEPTYSSKLLNKLVGKCLNSLQKDLISDFFNINETAEKTGNPDTLLARGVKITLTNGEITLDIFTSSFLIDHILSEYLEKKKSKQGKLDSIENIFTKEKTSFSVEYGTASLSVEEMLSIKAGDVIRLTKKIGDPVFAYSLSGERLFSGDIGINDNNFSIKVIGK